MKKSSSQTKPKSAAVEPMWGGALNAIASAFRLRQALLGSVGQGTAKSSLGDLRVVAAERRTDLTKRAVETLFPAAYLTARGLDREGAAEHNQLVSQVLESMLLAWDAIAVVANVTTDHHAHASKGLGLAVGFERELALRLAAYLCRYGYLHPKLAEVRSWLDAPKLQGWWQSVDSRATLPLKRTQLSTIPGTLDSHTIRALADGKSLPKESTIPDLASCLAAYGIKHRTEGHHLTPAELELELRFAVAVAEHRGLVERFFSPAPEDGFVVVLQLLHNQMLSFSDADTADLLRHGTSSQLWPDVEARLQLALQKRLVSMMLRKQTQAARKLTDERETLLFATHDAALLAPYLRRIDPRPGSDGPEHRVAELFEGFQALSAAGAGQSHREIPAPRAGLMEEMSADNLCLEAMAPWSNLSVEDREDRLREAVRVCPSSAYAHRSLAGALRRSGRIEEALHHLHRSLELNPSNEEGRESLALIHADREDYAQVLVLTESEAPSSLLRALRAFAQAKTGELDAAEQLARDVMEQNPRQALALHALALCHRSRGEEAKALELERKADFYTRGVHATRG